MKINTFAYVEGFKCIGGSCEDSCCIGWEVDIDKKTYEKYKLTTNSEIQSIVSLNLYKNEYYNNLEIDYAKVQLKSNKWCPFLTEDRWCLIQKNCGENHLSNVCKNFPRIYNRINGKWQLTLTLSCPVAATLLLTHDKPFDKVQMDSAKAPNIVTFTHEDKKAKGLFSKVEKINAIMLREIDKASNVEDLLNGVNRQLISIQEGHVKKRVFFKDEVLEIGKRYLTMLRGDRKLKETRLEKYLIGKPAKVKIDENLVFSVVQKYFYNDVSQNLFPFTEANTFDKSFIWLLIRISMLYYGLCHLVEGSRVEEIASFVSAYSKGVEHHHDFKAKAIKMF